MDLDGLSINIKLPPARPKTRPAATATQKNTPKQSTSNAHTNSSAENNGNESMHPSRIANLQPRQRQRQRQKSGSGGKSRGGFHPALLQSDSSSAAFIDAEKRVEEHPEEVFSEADVKSLGLAPAFAKNLAEQGFSTLTKIQKEAFTPFINGEDILMKSETGSGKTLAYLIPLIHMLSAIQPKIKREEGTYAIILAPTRELSIQTYQVIQRIIKASIWIISGTLMGGENKKAEKARLRKGLNIVIATPGRLLDHLKNTKALKCDKLRYLIMDEADRLLDLGFERDVTEILNILSKKSEWLVKKPQTVLVSATLRDGIDRLARLSLNNPRKIGFSQPKPAEIANGNEAQNKRESGAEFDGDEQEEGPAKQISNDAVEVDNAEDNFLIPKALSQFYVQVHCKLRPVALAAFLRWKLVETNDAKKIIVFVSCIDSVEFHHKLLSDVVLNEKEGGKKKSKRNKKLNDDDAENPEKKKKETDEEEGEDENVDDGNIGDQLLPVKLFKLHGDMSQKDRTTVFFDFCKEKRGVLICTDVAARGLDLPDVDWIIQYDTPGDPKEYLHRVGRTARLGHRGCALLFLMPHELPYVQLLGYYKLTLESVNLELILQSLVVALNRTKADPLEAASTLQYIFESIVESKPELKDLACRAYLSFIRAYATHSRETKHIFHQKMLHFGHVAKSFALRDKPSDVKQIVARKREEAEKAKLAEKRKTKKRITPAEKLKRYQQMLRGENVTGRERIQVPQKGDVSMTDATSSQPAPAPAPAPQSQSQSQSEQQQQQQGDSNNGSQPIGGGNDRRRDRDRGGKVSILDSLLNRNPAAAAAGSDASSSNNSNNNKSASTAFTPEELEEELFFKEVTRRRKNGLEGLPTNRNNSGGDANNNNNNNNNNNDNKKRPRVFTNPHLAANPKFEKARQERSKMEQLLKNPFSMKRAFNQVSEFDAGDLVMTTPGNKKKRTTK